MHGGIGHYVIAGAPRRDVPASDTVGSLIFCSVKPGRADDADDETTAARSSRKLKALLTSTFEYYDRDGYAYPHSTICDASRTPAKIRSGLLRTRLEGRRLQPAFVPTATSLVRAVAFLVRAKPHRSRVSVHEGVVPASEIKHGATSGAGPDEADHANDEADQPADILALAFSGEECSAGPAVSIRCW